MTFETVTMTVRHVVHVSGTPFHIEFFHLSDDSHDQQRFKRRVRVPVGSKEGFMPTAEDVIITKLRWFAKARRNKDWDDARDVIAVQGDALDWDYIHSWCDKHGTRQILEEVRRSIPPL